MLHVNTGVAALGETRYDEFLVGEMVVLCIANLGVVQPSVVKLEDVKLGVVKSNVLTWGVVKSAALN